MKLVQDVHPDLNQINSYGADWLMVNGEKLYGSRLVATHATQPWRPASFAELKREDFAQALASKPELVLFGSGSRIRFPTPALMRDLIDAHIGVETMDVGAVARTFNALAGEGRRVVALVLFE